MNAPGKKLLFFVFQFIFFSSFIFSQELVVNGDFETGDFTGWSPMPGNPSHNFLINDGTFNDGAFCTTETYSAWTWPIAPIAGNNSALLHVNGGASSILSSGIVLPDDCEKLEFSIDIEYESIVPLDFAFQNIMIDIVDNTMTPIGSPIYSAVTDGPQVQVPSATITADLTTLLAPFAGQMIYVRITNNNFTFCHPSQYDNVSLFCTLAPPPEPVPTMGEWGLMCLGLLLLIFGIVSIQQREVCLAD